ncbi:unnamed protein product [Rotaria sordida]|uniref:NAD(+)--protein-arginine ADP-ribosyltransferase n=1 Tax=Rotaria sordida TaxID=392033 RepID=A0A818VWJ1_9BILA|nr:unnamed protein product [Rotaria sordida]CAF3716763.1 unnamed protein product [Rotaria sordida]
MGNLLNWFKTLELFVNNRRAKQCAVRRSDPDHPEHVSPDKLTNINKIVRQSEYSSIQIETTVPPPTTTVASSNQCSDFYLACRNNNIEEVQNLLSTIDIHDIDRIEPNGSTALHAACFHGHQEIVELLLNQGANRAIQNKYGYLPFDEANNDKIKQLFYRIPNCNRFISNIGTIEWEIIDDDDDDVIDDAARTRHSLKSIFDNASGLTPMETMFEKIETKYIGKGLVNFQRIEDIKRFFRKATEEQDPIWIVTAYTAETDFYKILNRDIAGGSTQHQNERQFIIALLLFHPKLDHLSYTGPSYRVMQMNEDNIKKYKENCLLMTKSFVSSSIDEQIALWFLGRQELARKENGQENRFNLDGKIIKKWIMCKYQIKGRRNALHIENSSQYASEGEILIMPYTVFRVIKIAEVKVPNMDDEHWITEIQLEEYEQYIPTVFL